ncbi:MAG: dienelactone hydrolase family protein [Actinomycetes bacterium]
MDTARTPNPHAPRTPRRARRLRVALATASLVLASSACAAIPVTAFTSIDPPARTSETGVSWYAYPAPGNHDVRIAVVRAAGSGPHPTVLILPGSDGLHDEYLRLARAYAARGFDAVTGCWFAYPDPADRLRIDCSTAPAFTGVSEAAVSTLDALIAATQRATGVTRAHLGIVGYSRGGGIALLHAARTGSTLPIVDIAGMVTGQVTGFGGGPLPTDVNVIPSAGQIRASTLVLHGYQDGIIIPAQSVDLMTAMRNAGRDVSVHWYFDVCDGPCNHDLLSHTTSRTDVLDRSSTWLHQRIG